MIGADLTRSTLISKRNGSKESVAGKMIVRKVTKNYYSRLRNSEKDNVEYI